MNEPSAPELVVATRSEAESVLSSRLFEPPPAAPVTTGAVADLRSQMARFSGPDDHQPRRVDVELVIETLGDFPFAAVAERRAEERLTGARIDAVADVAFVVPTETLAEGLGVDNADMDRLRADVRAVVETIGRQRPTTTSDEESVGRLQHTFRDHPSGDVAAISLLYQNHDATAALVAAALVAEDHGTERRAAISRTVRVATSDTAIGNQHVPAGTAVIVDLESTGIEFGSGPHHCPGREIAEQIAAGIVSALVASRYRLRSDLATYHPDDRPKSLPMEPG